MKRANKAKRRYVLVLTRGSQNVRNYVNTSYSILLSWHGEGSRQIDRMVFGIFIVDSVFVVGSLGFGHYDDFGNVREILDSQLLLAEGWKCSIMVFNNKWRCRGIMPQRGTVHHGDKMGRKGYSHALTQEQTCKQCLTRHVASDSDGQCRSLMTSVSISNKFCFGKYWEILCNIFKHRLHVFSWIVKVHCPETWE